MRRLIRRSFVSARFNGRGFAIVSADSTIVDGRQSPQSHIDATDPARCFRGRIGHLAHHGRLPADAVVFTVHSRTGPSNRHASRVRTVPIFGRWIVRSEQRTVSGPLLARNDMPRLREWNCGGLSRRGTFRPASLASRQCCQKQFHATPRSANAYLAAFWLSVTDQGARSRLSRLNNGRQAVRRRGGLLASRQCPPCFGDAPVPGEARRPGVLAEPRFLPVVRVERDQMGQRHSLLNSAAFSRTTSSSFRVLWDRAP